MDSGKWQQMTVGQKVRYQRTKLNMSQSELQEKSGVDKGMISKIENGKKPIGLLVATRLAAVLKIKTDSLYKIKPRTERKGQHNA